jgi:hypothetical protein
MYCQLARYGVDKAQKSATTEASCVCQQYCHIYLKLLFEEDQLP